jgi:hypothetical protein
MLTTSIVSPEKRASLSLETDKKEVSMLLRIMRRIFETEMTQKMGRRSSGVNERAGRLNPGVHAEVPIRA